MCFQQVGDANLCFLCFNRIPIAWMRLKASRWLAEKMFSRFVLCLRNKWSIYWWANDGDWTRAWWIHNPLPWSTWLHPPLPPHRFQSLSTIRSFLPYSRYQREAFSYTIVASLLLCFGIRGNKASTSRSFLAKLQTKRLGFIDLTSLYLRLKKGAGRAVKAHLVDSERAASTYSYQSEPLSEKAIAR